jgi:hypothetical protein
MLFGVITGYHVEKTMIPCWKRAGGKFQRAEIPQLQIRSQSQKAFREFKSIPRRHFGNSSRSQKTQAFGTHLYMFYDSLGGHVTSVGVHPR